ncbi:hypothetical protein Tco_1351631 [Tanacetum coccineum]
MGDKNPIRTLGDYSKPSHEGYRNTIELPVGNNVVPLRSDTIQLVQNRCSFYELQFEDSNQHLKDLLKLVDSLDLDVANREEHCEIDCAGSGKLCDKNTDESWEIIENLALYDHGGCNDSKDSIKPVKAISNSLNKRSFNAYAEMQQKPISTNTKHKRNHYDPPRQNSFTFCEHVRPNPQPEALGTNFEARVRDYMAAHTERMDSRTIEKGRRSDDESQANGCKGECLKNKEEEQHGISSPLR